MTPWGWRESLRAAPGTEAGRAERRLFEELNPSLPLSPILEKKPARPRPASVLIPVIDRPEPTVLFTVRTPTMPSHAGQISFPGGGPKPDDDGPVGTALREAQEEVGIAPGRVEVLGTLGLHHGGLGYAVTPVIGLVHTGAELTLCPREVAEVFEVPLAHLTERRNHLIEKRRFNGTEYDMFAVPYDDRDAARRHIWGLTAGILESFCRAFNDDPPR